MSLVKEKINKTLFNIFSKNEARKKYDKKRKRILLTLDNKELSLIKKASNQVKKKPALFVKELILSQIKQESFLSLDTEKRLNEACILLRKIGGNINQITKLFNTDQKVDKEKLNHVLSMVFSLEESLINKVLSPK